MRGIVALAALLLCFNAYGQCPVETSIPDLGETGDTLRYTTNLTPADWRFQGPDGERFFEGSSVNVNFSQPGIYSGLLAGQNACEETIRIEFQVRIFDLMGEPRIQINGGAEFTNTQSVSIDLVTSGAVEYLISENSNCRTGEWKAMASSAPYELPFENAEGRVFAKFRTPIEESACVSDSIIHDNIVPQVSLQTSPAEVTNDVDARFVFDPVDSGSGIDTMLCGMLGPANRPCDLDSTFNVPEGPNTLVFRARDRAGNLSPVFMYDWRVDITKPRVEITEMPAILSNSSTAGFEFEGSDESSDIVGYTCQLVGTGVVPCDSPQTYRNLADTEHRFLVIAEDEAGNKSDPATYTWTVDTVAPTISFNQTPEPWEPDTAALLGVLVEDASEFTISCSLDNEDFKTCAAVMPVFDLVDGAHEMRVYATDAAGNQSETISHEWRVDATAPVVVFTAVPENPNSNQQVQIEFNANDNGSGLKEVRCQFDNDPVFTCVSPLDITSLNIGPHQIQIFALDEVGNQSETITYNWETQIAAPVLEFTLTPEAETTETAAQFNFVATSQVQILNYMCSLDGAAFTECQSPVSLTDLAESGHAFSVQAFDEFGQGSDVLIHNWFIDSVAPILSFTEVPAPIIEVPDAVVAFDITEAGSGIASIECQFDGQEFEICTSPFEAADMNEGPHSLSVRATDNLGNVSETISTGWEVNLTLPTVVFTTVPPLETPMLEAQFHFEAESSLGIDRIECDIDGSGFSICTSPAIIENLNIGTHTFSALAYDRLGRPSETISYTWEVIKLPDVIEEEFVSEGGSKKLDVLLVMDNSMSMFQERAKRRVRTNFKAFLSELKGLDWQLSMISTDARGDKPKESGRRVPFRLDGSLVLSPQSEGPERNLISTLIKFKGGSNREEAIWSTSKAIALPENQEFFRDGANLAVIIISDEDEKSTGKSSKPRNQPETLLKQISEKWGPSKAVQFNGVIWNAKEKGCETAYRRGRVYERLINATNGKVHSICQPEYRKGLSGYSDIAKGGDIVWELQCEPENGEFEVTYVPDLAGKPEVSLNGGRLTFRPGPPKGTKVLLRYSCARSLKQLAIN